MSEFTLDQWVEALGATKRGNEWRAACPVHDPDSTGTPDLDITKRNGKVLCTCRVCGSDQQEDVYAAAREVVAAFVNGATQRIRARPTKRSRSAATRRGRSASPLDWYADYTGVPRDLWEQLGCSEAGDYIAFDFPGVDARKKRKRGTRSFEWEGLEAPPLWPLPDDAVPKVVALTEGESDCGVLRHLGFHTFTTTKGAAAREGGVNTHVLRALQERGVEKIVVFADADSKGVAFRASLVASAKALSLECAYVDLSPYCDPTRGEKDARALYLRHGRRAFLELVDRATVEVEHRPYVDSFEDVLAWAEEDEGWLIEDLIARGTKTLLAAPAKSLKTYLILHLIAAGTTCTPLLGIAHYRIPHALRVLLVEEEGSRPMFGRRLRRVSTGSARSQRSSRNSSSGAGSTSLMRHRSRR